MLIFEGEELKKYKTEELEFDSTWRERDFVSGVRRYINGATEKVLAIGGLRGTGKTVGILQGIGENDVTYILAQKGEAEKGADYVNALKNATTKNIVIDEYSWINERDVLDKYLLTAVQNGKRVVLTATESIVLDYLKYGAINHRVEVLHTTMFTYEEYLRLYNKTRDKNSCAEFLTEGGLFKKYILKNFDSTKAYIEESIVKNLAGYLKKEMDEETARTLTYSVLYKAICPSNLTSVPTLRREHVTLDNFLEEMGVNSSISIDSKYLARTADIFEQAGIIVRIPNFDKESSLKEQYYITNPSISCQLIKATYGLHTLDDSILGHEFEAVVAIQLATNRLEDHDIIFYHADAKKDNNINKELDIAIVDKKRENAYLFECKFSQNAVIRSDATLVSGHLESGPFRDMDIRGRYLIYNGDPKVRNDYAVGNVILSPICSILDNYFCFEENVRRIGENHTSDRENSRMKELILRKASFLQMKAEKDPVISDKERDLCHAAAEELTALSTTPENIDLLSRLKESGNRYVKNFAGEIERAHSRTKRTRADG